MAKGVISPVSKKIRNDYGTLVCFCNKHDLNIATFKQIIGGHSVSQRVANILIEHGYINSSDDLLTEEAVKKRVARKAQRDKKIAVLQAKLKSLKKAA